MSNTVKFLITGGVLIWLYNDPQGAANFVSQAFSSLAEFISSL